MGELTPVVIVLIVIMAVIKGRWELRKQSWFWAVIVLMLALHLPLFFIVRWPPNLEPTKMRMLPFALADGFIVLGAVRFVEKFIVRTPDPKEPMFRFKKNE